MLKNLLIDIIRKSLVIEDYKNKYFIFVKLLVQFNYEPRN